MAKTYLSNYLPTDAWRQFLYVHLIKLWLKNSRVQENSVFSKTLISTFDISNVGVYLILKEWYSKEETLRVKL